jgi:hypothetical protein
LKRSEKLKERNHEVQTDCFGRPGQHMADFGGLGLQGIIMITHNGASTVRSEDSEVLHQYPVGQVQYAVTGSNNEDGVHSALTRYVLSS